MWASHLLNKILLYVGTSMVFPSFPARFFELFGRRPSSLYISASSPRARRIVLFYQAFSVVIEDPAVDDCSSRVSIEKRSISKCREVNSAIGVSAPLEGSPAVYPLRKDHSASAMRQTVLLVFWPLSKEVQPCIH
jgi:hypothetical protein